MKTWAVIFLELKILITQRILNQNRGQKYCLTVPFNTLVPDRTLKYVFYFDLAALQSTALLVLTPSSSNKHVQEALCLSFQGKKNKLFYLY